MEEFIRIYMWPFMMIGIGWCAWCGLRLIDHIYKWLVGAILNTLKEDLVPQWMRNELTCIKSKVNAVDHQYFVEFYDYSSNALISNNHMTVAPKSGDVVWLFDASSKYEVECSRRVLVPQTLSSLTKVKVRTYVKLLDEGDNDAV